MIKRDVNRPGISRKRRSQMRLAPVAGSVHPPPGGVTLPLGNPVLIGNRWPEPHEKRPAKTFKLITNGIVSPARRAFQRAKDFFHLEVPR